MDEQVSEDERSAIEAGDVVSLMSGGPNMVVAEVAGDRAECLWMNKNRIASDGFPRVLLRKVDRPRTLYVLGSLRQEDKEFLKHSHRLEPPQQSDVVVLRGSAVGMTVELVDAERATCVWFDGEKCIRAELPLVTLESRSNLDQRPLFVGDLLD